MPCNLKSPKYISGIGTRDKHKKRRIRKDCRLWMHKKICLKFQENHLKESMILSLTPMKEVKPVLTVPKTTID